MAKPEVTTFDLEDISKLIPQRPHAHVQLPSKGLYYDQTVVKDGVVELVPLSAREEKLIAGMRGNAVDEVIDTVLKRCLLTKIDPDDLLLSDRFYLLLVLRANSYGDAYNVSLECPYCGTSAKYVARIPKELTINYADPNNNFVIELPTSKLLVKYRYLTGKDQKEIKSYVETRKKQNVFEGDPAYIYTIAKHIVSVNNKTANMFTLVNLLEQLPAMDVAYFKDIYEESTPGVLTGITKTCVSCSREIETDLPITAEFFRPKYSAKK